MLAQKCAIVVYRKFVILAATAFLLCATARAQVVTDADSLRAALASASNDTVKIVLLTRLMEDYSEISPDSSYLYGTKLFDLAGRLSFRLVEAHAQLMIGYALLNSGNYPRSLRALLTGLAIAEDPESEKGRLPEKFYAQMHLFGTEFNVKTQRLNALMVANHYLGILYANAEDHRQSLGFLSRALDLAKQTENDGYLALVYSAMGRIYREVGNIDSAMFCSVNAYELTNASKFTGPRATIVLNLARTYLARGDSTHAIRFIKSAISVSNQERYYRGVVAGDLLLSDLYRTSHRLDSSLYFARDGLFIARQINAPDLLQRSYAALASFYRTTHNLDSTVKYIDLVNEINARNFSAKQAQEFQNIDFDETLRQREALEAEAAFRNQLQKYALMTGLLIVAIVAIFLWRISRQRQKSNAILQRQKKEIETAMTNLKAAQTQLVQSEKMASLGELTAGIAHEIQNPLNFVNNFSEVNAELATELVDAATKGNLEEVQVLARNIKENEGKISSHGKRADGIVKSMLQHSRTNVGQKEPTDINTICNEYLRLAYHGFRAKDKAFHAKFETSLDPSLPLINVVPQDIGRVLLNIINNAFYAVQKKKESQPSGYDPLVIVTTWNRGDKIEVIVRDNGNGVPDSIREKIFQPFFTTKPTGHGTGLGLSLSYDIVKAHGGELLVESKEGEGFSIKLVLQSVP